MIDCRAITTSRGETPGSSRQGAKGQGQEKKEQLKARSLIIRHLAIMISGQRALDDRIRDTGGDEAVVECRHGRRQRQCHQQRPNQGRKPGGRRTAAAAARRRSARLMRVLYVLGVAGIGLILVRVTNLSEGGHRDGAPVAKSISANAEAAWVVKREEDQADREGDLVTGSGGGRRRLVVLQEDVVDGMATEEEEEAAATAATCADNSFSGGGAGKVVLLVIAILFTFNGLAIVCDEFFQASLEKISEVLGLTPDVAGATFLAAGSSAPELFTSIADVFGPSNSIGVGTIVGSAMFNVLVIVALSAAVAAKSGACAKIDHRVVARDVSFYTCSIFMLVLFANDGKISWWEALVMVMAYQLYICFMIYNSRILAACSAPGGTVLPTVGSDLDAVEAPEKGGGNPGEQPSKRGDSDAGAGGGADVSSAPTRRRSSVRPGSADGGEGGERRGSQQIHSRRVSRVLRVSHLQERRQSQQARRASQGLPGSEGEDPMVAAAAAAVASTTKAERLSWGGQGGGNESAVGEGGGEGDQAVAGKSGASAEGDGSNAVVDEVQNLEDEEEEDRLAWPEGWPQRFLFIFGLPFLVALSLTVPDCSRPKYEKYYILTFVMSISWISIISSYMVALATGAACILGVSAIVMGVLVLAVGTSVPDMIGSMIAARNGEASMAIANAIGSNVFNILLGLGGPWLCSYLIYGEPTAVDSEGATTALVILFCAVLIFVGSLIVSRWSMNTTLAYCLLFTYASYVVYTIVAETQK